MKMYYLFVFRELDSLAIKRKVEEMFKNSSDLSQLFAGNFKQGCANTKTTNIFHKIHNYLILSEAEKLYEIYPPDLKGLYKTKCLPS